MFVIPLLIQADSTPEWVERFEKGKSIKDASKYYSGIGCSIDNQSNSDNKAREEFAKNVEVQVKDVEKEILKEKNGKVWESYVSITEIVTDVNLKGIHITERYRDTGSGTYYSLIEIQKDAYNQIVFEELQKELERNIYENKIDEAKQKEGIRSSQEQFKLWLEKETNKLKQKVEELKFKIKQKQVQNDILAKKKQELKDFIERKPPEEALTFNNAELPSKDNTISVEIGISPFSIQSVEYVRKIWKLTLSSYSGFHDNKFNRQDIALKYQILPNSGNINKITLAIGVVAFEHSIYDKKWKDVKVKFTPCFAGNISLPTMCYSYVSVYGDIRRYAIAVNSLLFFKTMRDRISFILEFDYIPYKNYRNRYNDSFLVQPGIRFRTTENIFTTIAYRNNELFTLSLEVAF